MRHLSFFLLTSVFLLCLSSQVIAEENRVIEKAEYIARSETSGDVKIKISNKVTPSISQLGGEKPRIILDFKETSYKTANKVMVEGFGLVSSLRFGLHTSPLKTRMVIDLAGVCEVEKPTLGEENGSLLVSLKCKGSEGVAQASQTPKVEKEATAVAPKEEIVEQAAPSANKEQAVSTQKNIPPAKAGDSVASVEKTPPSIPVAKQDIKKEAEEKSIYEKAIPPAVAVEPEKKNDSVEVVVLEPTESVAEVKEEPTEEPVVRDESKKEDALELLEIAFSRLEEKDEEVVLFYLTGFLPPEVSAVEDNKLQIICDFDGLVINPEIEKVMELSGNYLKSINISAIDDSDQVRVMMVLSSENDYDLQQTFYKNDNVFSLVITKVGQANQE